MGANSAEWTVNVLEGGKYTVILDYACTDQSAGSSVKIRAGKAAVSGIVKSTGGWGEFKDWNTGIITLSKGVNQLVVEAESRPGLGVMNCKGVRLIPVRIKP
jgi:hypothetical protein